jgi:organic radical activating enzyme
MKIRRDKNALVIFNEKTGTKLRLAIGKYEKAKFPELVDIKITDYCPFACTFCYQGSTLQGKHATWENMRYIVRELEYARVFEVALGGGEPTDHPDFIDILEEFHAHGIVANFTTKSLGWVKRNWNDIKDVVGAFAYSAETVKDLESASKMFSGIPRDKINIHYVMGLQDKDDFVRFMAKASELNFRVTLLGYKTTGRGKDVVPFNYDWWISAMQFLIAINKCPSVSIDTPLAQQYDGIMPVPKHMYHTKEGFVSAYIDAVAMKMGASSFENLHSLVPFDDDWVERYANIVPA